MSITGIIIACACGVIATVVVTVTLRKHFREVPIERTNTVTDEFIDKPIQPGVYLIVGPQGVGKTSFMNALISIDSKYHSQFRIERAQAEIDYLNKNGYHLTLPACAY